MDCDYICGIDIGTKNLGITFFSPDEIISYRGSPDHLKRYQMHFPVIDYKTTKTDEMQGLISILRMIREFKKTKNVRIEKQVSFHNSEILRIEGVIFGFLSSICENVEYVSSGRRMSFMKEVFQKNPLCEQTELLHVKTKKYREQKIPAMRIVNYFYPDFFAFILETVEDDKLDDICDSLIYALIDTFYVPGVNSDINAIKWKKLLK